jgi:hypothetical protein
MGMTDIVAGDRLFATNLAHFCHFEILTFLLSDDKIFIKDNTFWRERQGEKYRLDQIFAYDELSLQDMSKKLRVFPSEQSRM